MLKKLSLNLALWALLLAGALPVAQAAPEAQGTNLIVNGGFESGTSSWLPWWTEQAKPADGSFNYAFKPGSFNTESIAGGAAAQLVVAGDKSYRVINNWDPWFAGTKQVVTAPAGATVRLTTSVRIWTASEFWPAPSDGTVSAVTRVGLEPNGSENQFASTVVWSGGATPHGWQTQSVEAVVGASGKVTVILSADYRGYSRLFMGAFWDEVSLTVVSTGPAPQPTSGGGGGQPQPTARPVIITPIASPTPGADGNIIYIVQSGDSLTSICVSIGELNYECVDRIRQLNNLTSDILSVGQRLVIAQGAPSIPPTATVDPNAPTAVPTPDPALQPTATQAPVVEASPTPSAVGQVCVLMYTDTNGSGFRDGAEGLLAGGQVAVVEVATGQPVQRYVTDGQNEPHCFTDLAAGQYTVSAAAPTGYNSTTEVAMTLVVEAGTASSLEFGAQPGGVVATPTNNDSDRLTKALIGAAGVVFLLLAAGVAGFFLLRRK